MSTCPARSGAYSCQRNAEHTGMHVHSEFVKNAAGVHVSTLVTYFDNRSSVHTVEMPA